MIKRLLCVIFVVMILRVVAVVGYGCNDAVATVTSYPYGYEGTTTWLSYSNYSCKLYTTTLPLRGMYFALVGTGNPLTASLCDSNTDYDTLLLLFNVCPESGVATNCTKMNDDYCARKSSMTFTLSSGQVAWLFVTGSSNSSGHFHLTITEKASAAHGICADPQIIPDVSNGYYAQGTTNGTVAYYTSCRKKTVAGMWFQVTGLGYPLKAHTCDTTSNYDTVIEVYSSCDLNKTETCVTWNDDSCGTRSAVVWNAKSLAKYYVLVSGFNNKPGNFFLSIEPTDSASHWNCEAAIEVTALPFTDQNADNSDIPQTYSNCSGRPLYSLYYRVHGTGNQIMASTCNLDNYVFDTVIGVYDSCSNESVGRCVASNDDYCGIHSHVVFNTSVDKEYFVVVSGFNRDTSGGNFTLNIDQASNLGNDVCWGAEEITLPFATGQDTLGQATSAGCYVPATIRYGRWYKYKNTGIDQVVAAATCVSGTTSNTTVEVYTSCSFTTCVSASQRCNTSSAQSMTLWTAKSKTTYYIFVAVTSGEPWFNVEIFPSAYNSYSSCTNPYKISTLPFSISGETLTSDKVYTDCEKTTKRGMYFKMSGTGNKVIMDTCDQETDYNTMIDVYSDCKTKANNSNSVCMYSNDDYNDGDFMCGTKSYVSFDSLVGTDYLIFVTGKDQYTGIFRLNVAEESVPANSLCQNSVYFSSLPADTLGYTSYADLSNGSCGGSGLRRGLWFAFDGKEGVSYTLNTCHAETDFDTEIEIYSSCDSVYGGLECMSASDDRSCLPYSYVPFTPPKSQRYYVFVTGLNDANGLFRITISHQQGSSGSSEGGGGNGWAVFGIIVLVFVIIAAVVTAVVGGYIYYRRRKAAGPDYSILK